MIVCLAVGVRPWKDGAFDTGNFYALVAFAVSAAVLTAILSEFLRGAGVISRQTGRNLFAAMWLLTRRNTRRYGGYIIHIGVVIVVIGLAGSAFNRSVESEMALHDKLNIGPYTLELVGFTQDSNLNYNSDYARARRLQGRQEGFPDDAGEARLPRQRPAADHGGHSLRSRLGSVRGLRGHEPRHRPAHHQGVPESAGGLDLGRPGGHRLRHVHRAGSEPYSGNCCSARSGGASHPSEPVSKEATDEAHSRAFQFLDEISGSTLCSPSPSASRWAPATPARGSTTLAIA